MKKLAGLVQACRPRTPANLCADRRGCVAASAIPSSRAPGLSDIPGPRSWPLIGCTPEFYKRVSGFDPPTGPQMQKGYHEFYKEHGSIYKLDLLNGDVQVHICHPNDIMKVYRTEGKYPPGGAENLWIVQRWAKENGKQKLLNLNGRGQDWQDIRFAMQEDIISPKAARSYLPYINVACRLGSSNFQAFSEEADVWGKRVAFDMFTSLLYGLQMKTAAGKSSEADLDFVNNTSRVFDLIGASIFKGHEKMALFRNSALNKEFAERWGRSYDYSIKLMDRAVEEAAGLSDSEAPYLARILRSGKLPAKELQEVTAALLMAGIDTTRSVINWNLLYLAQNPHKQEKLREELFRELGHQPLTVEAVQKMKTRLPYLRAVVRETHRMAPPSPIMTLRAIPCDLELNGYLVPAGTKVAFQVYSLQNDKTLMPDADIFEPERWLPEQVLARVGTDAEAVDHKLMATPFSFGARMCLGGRAAELETYAVLCQVVRDWRFQTRESSPAWKNVQPLMSKAVPFPAFEIGAL